MRKILIALLTTTALALATPPPVSAWGYGLGFGKKAPVLMAIAPAATTPKQVTVGAYFWNQKHYVQTAVTVGAPATVRMVRTAYRQTTRVVTYTVQAGTTTINVPCEQYRLAHRWDVEIDGRIVAGASLNCR